MKFFMVVLAFVLVVFSGCTPPAYQSKQQEVSFTILQMNDVYEMMPLEGGKAGGLARVATVRKQLLKENPNVVTVLAGDFLSPSIYDTLKGNDGSAVAGAQMVDALNQLGLDYVTFGNHEFDLKEGDLLKRINQSEFNWVSCNVLHRSSEGTKPFSKLQAGQAVPIPTYRIHTFASPSGDKVRCAFIGLTIPENIQPHVQYLNVSNSLSKSYEVARTNADLVFAITHLEHAQDRELATRYDNIPLFLGGHDHVNMKIPAGKSLVTKADANAKSVYIHRFRFNPANRKVQFQSELKMINETIPEDAGTGLVVSNWHALSTSLLKKAGFQPDKIIYNAKEPLDGRESIIRKQPTNLSQLIAESMLAINPGMADAAIFNSGSIRLDDKISGAVREYDILRALPFGGAIGYAAMDGQTLEHVLQIGTVTNVGSGGFLQTANLSREGSQWLIGGDPIDSKRQYKVALLQFLAQGREVNLSFLKDVPFEKPLTLGPDKLPNDIRQAFISYLEKMGSK